MCDPEAFLLEAFRCLSPGGTILITVPFAARWHFIPLDYWRFTPSGLAHLLQKSGFVNTAVYARGNAFTVACYKFMALVLRLAMPQTEAVVSRLALQIISVPFLPALVLLAVLGNCSLAGQGGDDCLGYTAISEKESL